MTENIGNRDLIIQIQSILEEGGDISTYKDVYGNTLLHSAIIQKNESAVQMLLEMGVDLSVRNAVYRSALTLAILGDLECILDRLIEKGARLDASDIFEVISQEKLQLLEKLLDKGLDVNYRTEGDKSLLHVAVQKNCIPAVEMLLMRGADINVRTKTGHCPLHLARTPEILELLLTREPDLNSKTRFGHSPLHRMICNNFRVGVEMLLRRGAQPNVKDWSGATPLHFAVQDRNADLVKTLLNGGADMEIINLQNKTPLNLTLFSPFKGGVRSFLDKRAEILKYNKNYDPLHYAFMMRNVRVFRILSKWKDLDVKDEHGYTLLHCAVLFKNKYLIKTLLDKGVNLNSTDKNGQTPLHLGVRMKFVTGVDLLLKKGADVNVKDNRGRSPLHFAVMGPWRTLSYSFTEKLLVKGADVNIKNVKGRTPLHVVIKLSKYWMTEILLYSGAHIETVDNDGKTPLDLDCLDSAFSNISKKITKLKCIGFDSHIDYAFIRSRIPTFHIWENFFTDICLRELQIMKLDMFGNHSLYNIFGSYSDPKFVCNSAMEEAVKSSTTAYQYPIYFSLLKMTFEKAKVRHNLLDTTELKIALEPNNLCYHNVTFPHEIRRKILTYLSDKDLHNLKKANQV
uniref:PRANC domain-containing protein n=1 Tax=Cuerna arida TaxID=1464854 RepID=A0A1B6FAU4_9HEMI